MPDLTRTSTTSWAAAAFTATMPMSTGRSAEGQTKLLDILDTHIADRLAPIVWGSQSKAHTMLKPLRREAAIAQDGPSEVAHANQHHRPFPIQTPGSPCNSPARRCTL